MIFTYVFFSCVGNRWYCNHSPYRNVSILLLKKIANFCALRHETATSLWTCLHYYMAFLMTFWIKNSDIFVLCYYYNDNDDAKVLVVVFSKLKVLIFFLPNSGKWGWNNCTKWNNCWGGVIGLDESWGQGREPWFSHGLLWVA